MTNTIYASFEADDQAIKAAGALLDYGVKNEDLTIISQGTESALHAYGIKASSNHDDDDDLDAAEATAKKGISTTTPADAAAGAAKGAGIGLATGVIAGLASLFIPGIGLVLGGGALAAALGGAALTTGAGILAGGVTGYLKDQGIPEEQIVAYNNVVSQGGAIVAVTLPSDEVGGSQIMDVLNKYGAMNISNRN